MNHVSNQHKYNKEEQVKGTIMINVKLYGSLKKFGESYELNASDAKECIRALAVQLDNFKDELLKCDVRLVWGDLNQNRELDAQTLSLNIPDKELHIIPSASGAGGGSGKIISGVALIGASFFVPGAGLMGISALSATTVGVLGTTLALTGVAQSLAPNVPADYESQQRPDERASYIFDGPVNRAGEGIAVPLIIGEVLTGSIVVSSGLDAEQL
jgi:predicted phage tail protein